MPPGSKSPPFTPEEPFTEVLHGIEITDPYRWLEDQNSQRTRKWIQDQGVYTRSYLSAISGREKIRTRIEALLAVETISEPWKIANRYFFIKRSASQERPAIMMREGDAGTDVILVDPTDVDTTGASAINIVGVSPYGTILAFSVRNGGEDSSVIRFLDVDNRTIMADILSRGLFRGLVFASNNEGFYYSHQFLESALSQQTGIVWHTFGTPNTQDTSFFAGADPLRSQMVLFGSSSGKRLGYYNILAGDPTTVDFIVHDIDPYSSPKVIVEQIEGCFLPFFAGNQLVALTDWEAPNSRVVLIDINRPQRENWKDIVPEEKACIQDIAVADELIFVKYTRNISSQINVVDLSGTRRGELDLPSPVTATLFPCRDDSDAFFYSFTSFSHPPTTCRYSTTTGRQEIWARSKVPFDATAVEVKRAECLSKDGTRVPVFLVAHKDRLLQGPLPTFLTGYGGFGIALTPQFTAYATFLMEQGCLFALTNLRGGSEFGKQWHLAAKRANRQNAIDDFIAAAEWLINQGYAARDRIAIGGGSNAGLLVAAALTQRPDLFRAVVCLGPLLDMLRYHMFDSAALFVDEYGSADNERDFPHLRAYSPYHNVRDGLPYPATMFISGDADMRCNPMHARKMTARLQAATSSDHAVLLDYRPTWGHMPVQPLTVRIDALTDRLAFICHELGVRV